MAFVRWVRSVPGLVMGVLSIGLFAVGAGVLLADMASRRAGAMVHALSASLPDSLPGSPCARGSCGDWTSVPAVGPPSAPPSALMPPQLGATDADLSAIAPVIGLVGSGAALVVLALALFVILLLRRRAEG